jgi:uncharacterized membrane protein
MIGTIDSLIAATAVFVASHVLLSSRPLRARLVRAFGEGGFRGVYSLAAIVALVWMVKAYGAAPMVFVWYPPVVLNWVPLIVMPVACILLVCSLTTPSVTRVGGEQSGLAGGVENPAPGIISITRHPGLWAFALWALSHLMVNGDAASMIMMGGILALSLGGMAHIDLRREEALGSDWGPTKMTTSVVPFAAILSGRTHLDWKGIGWQRPLAGLALFVVLLYAHPWIAGVAVIPY